MALEQHFKQTEKEGNTHVPVSAGGVRIRPRSGERIEAPALRHIGAISGAGNILKLKPQTSATVDGDSRLLMQ